MHTRRTFIEGALAVSALAAGAATARVASPRPDHALVERTLAEGAAFRAAMHVRGIDVIDTPGDIAAVWMRVLAPRLRAAPAVIAGLTHAGPLFCLEELARDYGLRAIVRIAHERLDDGRIVHRSIGAGPGPEGEQALRSAGAQWPAVAARLLASGTDPMRSAGECPPLDIASMNRSRQPLLTWMLAPDPRRRALLAR